MPDQERPAEGEANESALPQSGPDGSHNGQLIFDETRLKTAYRVPDEKPTHAQIVSGYVRYFQEGMRGVVCLLLLATVVWILWFSSDHTTSKIPSASSKLGAAGAVAITNDWVNVKDWMQIALPTMSGFLGIALGFYFSTIIIDIERRH